MASIYKLSAPISFMKSFESPNGCSSFYIQWFIGKLLSRKIVKDVKSVAFRAGNAHMGVSYQWRFEFVTNEESRSANISFARKDYKEDDDDDDDEDGDDNDDDDDYAPDVPMVCRLSITNDVTGITKYGASMFLESTKGGKYNFNISANDLRDLDFPKGDYIINCWLDLPTKVIGGDSPWKLNPQGNFGLALQSSSIAALFNEVVSHKTNESDGTSDVVLIIKEGDEEKRRFYCHRNILSVRSPVFDTMLTNKRFKEGNERQVEIEDVKGSVMKKVLKYIYTGECPLASIRHEKSIYKIIDAAEKYMLPELKDECVRQLIAERAYDDDAWADRLAMSEMYNIDYLKKISILALSSNIRSMDDEKIREKLSKEAITGVTDMAAKRWERSRMLQLFMYGRQ